MVRESAWPGSFPGSERPPGERNCYPLQSSCMENSMDRGAWWAIVHGVPKSRTQVTCGSFLTLRLYVCWKSLVRACSSGSHCILKEAFCASGHSAVPFGEWHVWLSHCPSQQLGREQGEGLDYPTPLPTLGPPRSRHSVRLLLYLLKNSQKGAHLFLFPQPSFRSLLFPTHAVKCFLNGFSASSHSFFPFSLTSYQAVH